MIAPAVGNPGSCLMMLITVTMSMSRANRPAAAPAAMTQILSVVFNMLVIDCQIYVKSLFDASRRLMPTSAIFARIAGFIDLSRGEFLNYGQFVALAFVMSTIFG